MCCRAVQRTAHAVQAHSMSEQLLHLLIPADRRICASVGLRRECGVRHTADGCMTWTSNYYRWPLRLVAVSLQGLSEDSAAHHLPFD